MVEGAPWRLRALEYVPRKWLSRTVGKLVHAESPHWWATFVRDRLISYLNIPTHEAEKPVEEYHSFGAFFARKLKEGVRTISDAKLVSPCDGSLEEEGRIEEGRLYQCKGKTYPLYDLVGDVDLARHYEGGRFMTIYLAPHNYHRVHWPISGQLEETRFISGDFWPVNRMSVEYVEGLFCLNERYLSTIETGEGKLTLVMVGATNVGDMDIAHLSRDQQEMMEGRGAGHLIHKSLRVNKGEEFGIFNMGSTVILLLDSSLSSALNVDHAPHGQLLFGQGLNE